MALGVRPCSHLVVSDLRPIHFRPMIALGVRLEVEAFADRFTFKRPLRQPRVVMLADIRHLGIDRSPSPAGLKRGLTALHLRMSPKLVTLPLDIRDAETQRFLAWLATAAPAADIAALPWNEAAQLLGVGKGFRLFASKLFVVGFAFVIGAVLFGAAGLSVPIGSSRAFAAGYRSAPLVLLAAGIVMMVVGWRRQKKSERSDADKARASQFD